MTSRQNNPAAAGLANLSRHFNLARFFEQPSSSEIRPRSRIPVFSRPPVVVIPATPSTLSPKSPSSKTEASILKHVERLRKVKAAQSTYKTSVFKAVSKPAQPRPVSRPASRVPSSSSSSGVSSSSSRSARTEDSINAHIQRVAKARAKSPASARSSPATSRKVTPIQPLLIKKQARATVNLAEVDNDLARLSVAPLAVKASKPEVPVLRSCLRSSTAARSTKPRQVRFVDYGGWNIHGVKAFIPDSAPNSFVSLSDVDLLQPTQSGRQRGPVYDGNYSLAKPGHEIRWPPPTHDGEVFEGYEGYPPQSCRACAMAASKGTPTTRYHANMQSIWCGECLSDPGRRPYFVPALDLDGDDSLDRCPGGKHNHHHQTCQYFTSAYKANVNWLYAHYPERYDQCDAVLAD
ncbi:uncharacterized protein L3040_002691 [Drepanopeziza brunnea f. sp. 'multigermtubi']|uniref:Uncharacterized protein n=1 Tax=Marssonina brunnea f. sp. multigermtubi (strain MB_m1) TaxID=1072389 RepID=K1WKQ6_MARBU|nr:uncharacterized protein MBM_08534 [Drepanopeziza brunnea f. sp. 'multigermtubi' MB_m1]EKD13451.1 hypothetical protein MBM_08534 [Drepanopeziza brunnea f. sp. 'multigermtubi' MB_m1]KAJ5050822.1 hypothetical protein L3040_002691 [Drepanopeziza brunnea f. sp. 'multigermtubi']